MLLLHNIHEGRKQRCDGSCGAARVRGKCVWLQTGNTRNPGVMEISCILATSMSNPGCDVVLQFCKRLPLAEVGSRVLWDKCLTWEVTSNFSWAQVLYYYYYYY